MEVTSEGMHLWFLVLLLFYVSTLRVDSQLDTNGFINIDCGLAANSTFYDDDIELTFVSDEQFIDTGVNYQIQSQYSLGEKHRQLMTLRSFPNGTRNCYTLRSLTIGSKYLVKGLFLYGNYDNLNKPPSFDVHLGVNYWDTVETTKNTTFYTEIIALATSDYLQVCLVDKNIGTPFISVLQLKQLKTGMYEEANSTQSLSYWARLNLGAIDTIRYPDDRYDRIWQPCMQETWIKISNRLSVDRDTDFVTPSLVMQTAATTSNTTQSLDLYWNSNNKSTVFFVILHISELQDIPSTAIREFDIFANGILVFDSSVVPGELYSGWASYTHRGWNQYHVSLKATSNSTLPPLLNAFELYVIRPVTGITTNREDVTAMNTIKANYKVNKDWSGDPCAPKEFLWRAVTCISDSTKTPRITALNLSSSGLTGGIVSSFGDLSALQILDLSYNDLSGDLPTFLDKLSALTYLDITGNDKISTTLPPDLQRKKQDKILTFRTNPTPSKKSPVVIIAVAGVVVLILIAASIIVVCLRRRKYVHSKVPKQIESYETTPRVNISGQNYANISKKNEAGEGILDFENRRFSYNDLTRITNKFQNNIGTGGFGKVYVGALDNGTQVAVKMRSHSSSQGLKEFLAEAKNLARVHHRCLVSLVGYCMDGDCMALVYEYMQEGTLQDKLMGDYYFLLKCFIKIMNGLLSWKQRIQIAYESALGLEYLHKACNPPLIHRDVKTNNILLNATLEAKIADFGLSRAFNNNLSSHVSTAIVGTPGYLDPEYYSSYQLSEKSDVFSFGVVLLEIITGKPPIIAGPEGEGGHLKQWVDQKLSRGDIESIVDQGMQGQYDINSVWKVTDLARKCTGSSSAQRPTMSVVVAELKESLDLEISIEGTHSGSTNHTNSHYYSTNDNFVSDVSQNSAFDMANMMEGMPAPDPIAR